MSESSLVGDKSHLPRRSPLKGDDTFARIWKFYYETKISIKLTEQEKKIRERWEFSWKMDSELHNKWRIAQRIHEVFGVSIRTGYEDIKQSRLLFSDPSQKQKEADRLILSNILKEAIKAAKAEKDYMAVDRLIMRFDKLNGLSLDQDAKLEEYMNKQKPSQIVFSTDASVLRQQAEDLMADVEDVGYEEIEEEPPGHEAED